MRPRPIKAMEPGSGTESAWFSSNGADGRLKGDTGAALADGDVVISMSILKHVNFDTETRDAYLKAVRKLRGGDEADEGDASGEDNGNGHAANGGKVLTDEEFKRMAAAEEFILTVTNRGFGKRTSAYEYLL